MIHALMTMPYWSIVNTKTTRAADAHDAQHDEVSSMLGADTGHDVICSKVQRLRVSMRTCASSGCELKPKEFRSVAARGFLFRIRKGM
jgi:hypothetical protein